MTDTHNNRESGQIIVLMALLMVILIGALGLAIDGGRLFYLWRNAQNATDAAVLAASYARCTNGDVVNAGLDAARLNGFNNNGIDNTVSVYNPPISGEKKDNKNYVQVHINGDLQPYFIQLVYNGPLEVTTEAVGYCIPKFDPHSVAGLWAGSTDCDVVLDWTGSGGILEGGMFSNDEIALRGSDVTIIGPVEMVDYMNVSKGGKIYFDPEYGYQEGVPVQDFPLNFLNINDYAPGGKIATSVPIYYGIEKKGNEEPYKSYQNGKWSPPNGAVLEGLYYVKGDIVILPGVNVGPKGVTLVATGTISIQDPDVYHFYDEPVGPDGGGILAYSTYDVSKCGEDAIHISGVKGGSLPGEDPAMMGVLVAPKGGVGLQSTQNAKVISGIFAYTINLSGSFLHLIYDPEMLEPIPPSVQIAQ